MSFSAIYSVCVRNFIYTYCEDTAQTMLANLDVSMQYFFFSVYSLKFYAHMWIAFVFIWYIDIFKTEYFIVWHLLLNFHIQYNAMQFQVLSRPILCNRLEICSSQLRLWYEFANRNRRDGAYLAEFYIVPVQLNLTIENKI